MKEEMLKQLIEKTFTRLACPLQGNGVYAEIQQAVMAAYQLGKKQVNTFAVPEQLLLSSNFTDN